MLNPSAVFSFIDENHDPSVFPENENKIIYSRIKKLERKTINKGISVKFVVQGEELYRVNQFPYHVRTGEYLLINDRRDVVCNLDSEVSVEGLCVYLNKDLLREVYRELRNARKIPLDIPIFDASGRMEICEHVYKARGNELGNYLIELSARIRQAPNRPPLDIEDIIRTLAEKLIRTQLRVFEQLERLSSTKLSTKKELYRRLCMARTHIHSNLNDPLDLDTLAQVACLSKFHFIRLFKEVFDQTPRQYLITRRLEAASTLLVNSSKSFHEICQEVGLKDSSSFGRLFKRSYGATPHLYRRMHAS
ncbi:MAG: AraC family transcriptional regulator [Bacteroidia bacterium]|nr:AraC family transcriptional regulator [Bacteroidia bacterium]